MMMSWLERSSNPLERGRSSYVDRSSRFDYAATSNLPVTKRISDKDRKTNDDELAYVTVKKD